MVRDIHQSQAKVSKANGSVNIFWYYMGGIVSSLFACLMGGLPMQVKLIDIYGRATVSIMNIYIILNTIKMGLLNVWI